MTIASWDDACLHNFTVVNASNCTDPYAPGLGLSEVSMS
jgi:hypothetical protein